MIHNEIIIINKLGFSKNTKMFLDMELEEEIKDIRIFTGDDEENDTFAVRASISEMTINED